MVGEGGGGGGGGGGGFVFEGGLLGGERGGGAFGKGRRGRGSAASLGVAVGGISGGVVSRVVPSAVCWWGRRRARCAVVAPRMFAVVSGWRSAAGRGLSFHPCAIRAWASGAMSSPAMV